ncbi:MAG TPA: 3-dehydroquinate synthase [Casimicrobiaceae bacterium]|nr:3-dehydroquinate synthase [Casimicrobiaceae bacterium]
MTQRLDVSLSERGYPIHVGSGLLRRAGGLLSTLRSRRAIVVTNAIVASHWLQPLRDALAGSGFSTDVVMLPAGEAHKNLRTLEDLLTRLAELKAERSTVLVALGGGVIGDIAGFAAAVYQRGMPFVQVPTTLLAQVDSSVGGKTGVNHPLGKNLIGAFWQPSAVVIDIDCLTTLPDRELSAGLAEVIKYGAIRDAAFFDWVEASIDDLRQQQPQALERAIVTSCRIKAAIVAADEREEGERALLNFGHTFGHAIESATGYGVWLHGEAVAAGMCVAAKLSTRVSGLADDAATRLASLLARAGLPVWPPSIPFDRWLALIAHDKKVESGVVRFVLLESLGRAVVRSGVARETLAGVLS